MSKGFQIEIQNDLNPEDKDKAIKMANYWMRNTINTDLLIFVKGKG